MMWSMTPSTCTMTIGMGLLVHDPCIKDSVPRTIAETLVPMWEWVPMSTYHWVPMSTYHWVPMSTYHWVPMSTYHWVHMSTCHSESGLGP